MAITLEQAKLNTLNAYDPAIIDEFRSSSTLLDLLQFDQAVNPAGGGATMTYGYRRLKERPTAAFREINSEYTPSEATTEQHSVVLKALGGSFKIDRLLANLGPAASNEVALQTQQLVKATVAKFSDAVINGDSATGGAFDGLDKALKDSSTEIGTDSEVDWTNFDSDRAEHKALDTIDEFLDVLDGAPTVILGNKVALARVRAAARRAGMYTRNPVEGLLSNGRPVEREAYGSVVFMDPGIKPGSNDPIIPIQDGKTSLYAVRMGLDGFHGVATTGEHLLRTWMPDFTKAGAVQTGEVELGPVAVVLKSTRAAAALRNVKVRAN